MRVVADPEVHPTVDRNQHEFVAAHQVAKRDRCDDECRTQQHPARFATGEARDHQRHRERGGHHGGRQTAHRPSGQPGPAARAVAASDHNRHREQEKEDRQGGRQQLAIEVDERAVAGCGQPSGQSHPRPKYPRPDPSGQHHGQRAQQGLQKARPEKRLAHQGPEQAEKIRVARRVPEHGLRVAPAGRDRRGQTLVGASVDDRVVKVGARAHGQHVRQTQHQGQAKEQAQCAQGQAGDRSLRLRRRWLSTSHAS